MCWRVVTGKHPVATRNPETDFDFFLSVPERIEFKIAVLTYKVLCGALALYSGSIIPYHMPLDHSTR